MGEKIVEIRRNILAIIKSPNFEEDVTGSFDKIETDRGLHFSPSLDNSNGLEIKAMGLTMPIVFLAPVLATAVIPAVGRLAKDRKARLHSGEEFEPSSYSEGLISLPFDNLERTLLTDVKISVGLKIVLNIVATGQKHTLISYQGTAIINGAELPVEIETAGNGTAEEFAEAFQDCRPEIDPSTISLKEFNRKGLLTSL
jgi:hypothetical protein